MPPNYFGVEVVALPSNPNSVAVGGGIAPPYSIPRGRRRRRSSSIWRGIEFLFGSDWQCTYEQLNNLEFICMTDMHRYTAR